MEQPPKQPEGEGEQEDKEPPQQQMALQEAVSIPEDSEEVQQEREEIRARLHENARQEPEKGGVDEKEEPSEEKPGHQDHHESSGRSVGRIASVAYRPVRGFFGLMFMWFFGGIKKSFGGKVGSDHGGGGAKKPSGGHGGGHGGGGGHH